MEGNIKPSVRIHIALQKKLKEEKKKLYKDIFDVNFINNAFKNLNNVQADNNIQLYKKIFDVNFINSAFKNLNNVQADVQADNNISYEKKLSINAKYITNLFNQYHKELRVYRKNNYYKRKEQERIDDETKARVIRAVRKQIRKDKWEERIKKANEKADKKTRDKKISTENHTENKEKAIKIIKDLLKNNIEDIKISDEKITELNEKINKLEGGPKPFIDELSQRSDLRKNILSSTEDTDKIEKLEKIITILKQLNSNNYLDYGLESILEELKTALGGVDDVDTSIPESLTTTTITEQNMYSEPLSICDEESKECGKNKDKLKKRIEYFQLLRELQNMHKHKKVKSLQNNDAIKNNINALYEYLKPFAEPTDSVIDIEDYKKKQKKKFDDLPDFIKLNINDDKFFKEYDDVIDKLNKKDSFKNPQIDADYMTTNTTVKTDKSIFHDILKMENLFKVFGKNSNFYNAMYSTPNGDSDPRHKTIKKTTEINKPNVLTEEEK